MIISPSPRPTTNILHCVNNSYKCVDLAYMFGESEEDCNLWLQKLYWARDPEDSFRAPNFTERWESVFLVRDDLAGPTPVSEEYPFANSSGVVTLVIPYTFFTRNGYAFSGHAFNRTYVRWLYSVRPNLVTDTSDDSREAIWKWALTQSYFPPQTLQMLKDKNPVVDIGRPYGAPNPTLDYVVRLDELENFDLLTAITTRLQFGRKRKIRSVLFYRPHKGFLLDAHFQAEEDMNDLNEIQLLRLPEYGESYELLAAVTEQADFKEHEDSLSEMRKFPYAFFIRRVLGGTQVWREQYPNGMIRVPADREYLGGMPMLVNLDSPLEARELYLRWSGQLSHINLLEVPIVRPSGWSLVGYPDLKYTWPHQKRTVEAMNPGTDLSALNLEEKKFEYIGDLTTVGLRFLSPRVLQEKIDEWPNYYDTGSGPAPEFGKLADDPYQNIDIYSARCVWYGEKEDEVGDLWELENFGRPPKLPHSAYTSSESSESSGYPDMQWRGVPWFSASKASWKEPDGPQQTYYDLRDVSDNRAYVANKLLVGWYYNPITNTWNSNRGRASTENQLRFIVTFKEPAFVKGCLNPMSVPAIWNKPRFYADGSNFRLDPKLFSDYLVPSRVLIEGRVKTSEAASWELMDEFTLDHFSTRASVEFSYPMEVRQIRITIQEWYGTTFLDDIKKDWFYPNEGSYNTNGTFDAVYGIPIYGQVPDYPGGSLATPVQVAARPSDHWVPAGSIHAPYVLRRNMALTVGDILGGKVSMRIVDTRSFLNAHKEMKKWEKRTIPSLWQGIYIPPFLFFGGEEDAAEITGETGDGQAFSGVFVPVDHIQGMPEGLGMAPTDLELLVQPSYATNDVIQWSVPSGNATVDVWRVTAGSVVQKAVTRITVTPQALVCTDENAEYGGGVYYGGGKIADLMPKPILTFNNNLEYFNEGGSEDLAERQAKVQQHLLPYFTPITLRATVKNGLDWDMNFVKDFELPVTFLMIATSAMNTNALTVSWSGLTWLNITSPDNSPNDLSWAYSEFIAECCHNPGFVYYEECELYPPIPGDCSVGPACPLYDECGCWEGRKQRVEPDRHLLPSARSTIYNRLTTPVYVRIRAVGIIPELDSLWSRPFEVPAKES